MSDTLEDVKNQILSLSLAVQIHLLNFIANCINKQTSILNKNFSEDEPLRKLRETSHGDSKPPFFLLNQS